MNLKTDFRQMRDEALSRLARTPYNRASSMALIRGKRVCVFAKNVNGKPRTHWRVNGGRVAFAKLSATVEG